jgi:OOP family OmpA-OmpF porin
MSGLVSRLLSARGWRLPLASLLGACLGVASVSSAQAQQVAPAFLLNRFTPATPGSDWFVLESLDFRGQLRPGLRLGLDWSQRPFVYEDASRKDVGAIVERQVYLHLGLSLTVADRARLAVDLPLAVQQKGAASPVIAGIVYPGPEDSAAADVRATVDVRLYGQYGEPFVLAVGSHLFIPTVRRQYNSDGIVRVLPRVMAAGEAGLFAYAASVGFHSRDRIADEWFQGYGIGHELFGGLALGVKPVPSVLLGAEMVGYSKVDGGDLLKKRRTPAELLFGGRFVFADQLRLAVGAGPGLTPSKGSPEVRFVARLEWSPAVPPPDADGDGIVDNEDACPALLGPRTGAPATSGCPPPPDRDRDGILDGIDACPDDPGVKTATPATNGCPPPRDRDGDGVFDPADACPDNGGVKTDDPRSNGCPPDGDSDGVLDADDACPQKAGDKSDDPRTTGCPDGDGDGIRDPQDACPEAAGPADPDARKNGCPMARVESGQVRILEQVKFRSGSSTVLPASDALLQAVAKILSEHPEIKKVRVEGHTDNLGGKTLNQNLSKARAAAVVSWLVKKGGVDRGRLVSEGLGMDSPVADNASEEGRTANRRVEFHVVDPAPEAAPGAPPQ